MVVYLIIIYKNRCLVNLAHMVIVPIIDSTEKFVGHVMCKHLGSMKHEQFETILNIVLTLWSLLAAVYALYFFIFEFQNKLEHHNIISISRFWKTVYDCKVFGVSAIASQLQSAIMALSTAFLYNFLQCERLWQNRKLDCNPQFKTLI